MIYSDATRKIQQNTLKTVHTLPYVFSEYSGGKLQTTQISGMKTLL